jgi:hypothetical protein
MVASITGIHPPLSFLLITTRVTPYSLSSLTFRRNMLLSSSGWKIKSITSWRRMGGGCIDPRIINLGTSLWVVSFTPRPLYSQWKNSRYPLDMRLAGPQNRFWRCGEEKNLLSARTGTPTPQQSKSSQTLYRLRYPVSARNHDKRTRGENHSSVLLLDYSTLKTVAEPPSETIVNFYQTMWLSATGTKIRHWQSVT